MASNYDFVGQTPLLDHYFTKGIAEVIWDNDCDPFVAYLELESADVAGGNDDALIVRICDDGDILVSPDYALAGGSDTNYKFTVTTAKLEWRATVLREALDATKGNTVGVFDVLKNSITKAVRRTMTKLSKHASTKRGCLGVIQAKSGQTLTISSITNPTVAAPDLMNRFNEGMVIQSAAAFNTGNLRGSTPGDTITIDAGGINYGTGVLTCTGTITNFTVGDFVFEYGDSYYSRVSRRTVSGIMDWLDPVAPTTGESFYGQDRLLASSLQAIRFAATGLDLRVALMRMRQILFTRGRIHADTVFVSPLQYAAIEEQVEKTSIVDFNLKKDNGDGRELTIGLAGIKLTNARGGTMMLVQLPWLESGICVMGNTKKAPFKLAYTDKLIRTDTTAGSMWEKVLNGVSNGTETVAAYRAEGSLRGAIYCTNPAQWVVASGFYGI